MLDIVFDEAKVVVRLDRDESPLTYDRLVASIPFESEARRWGEEIYFEAPFSSPEESPRIYMEIGDVAYWPPGRAICIFFGRTPVSDDERPKAYSPVNPLGRVIEGIESLRSVRSGERVRVVLHEPPGDL